MGGRWPGPGAGIRHEAAGMSRSGCAGKSWEPHPDPPSVAGRTRAPQGPPALPAGKRDLGAPRHPSLQGQECVTSHRETVGMGGTGVASGGLCAHLCGSTQGDPVPGHSEVTPAMVAPSLHQDWGATLFPQSRGFPVGMHSPLGRGLEPCPAGYDPGLWCPDQRDPPSQGADPIWMPGQGFLTAGNRSRLGDQVCGERGEADPGIRGEAESLGRWVPVGTSSRSQRIPRSPGDTFGIPGGGGGTDPRGMGKADPGERGEEGGGGGGGSPQLPGSRRNGGIPNVGIGKNRPLRDHTGTDSGRKEGGLRSGVGAGARCCSRCRSRCRLPFLMPFPVLFPLTRGAEKGGGQQRQPGRQGHGRGARSVHRCRR